MKNEREILDSVLWTTDMIGGIVLLSELEQCRLQFDPAYCPQLDDWRKLYAGAYRGQNDGIYLVIENMGGNLGQIVDLLKRIEQR